MRWVVAGVMVALLLGGVALGLAWRHRQLSSLPADREAATAAANDLKRRFRATHAPDRTVDVRDFPQAERPMELIHAPAALPQTHLHDVTELRALRQLERDCVAGEGGKLEKAWTFARARCGLIALPEAFFSTPPFMHPSGVSFARLAGGTHYAFMHHRELRSLPVPEPLSFFAQLSSEEALLVTRAGTMVVTPSHVLLRQPANERAEAPRYDAFDRAAFASFVARAGWAVTALVDVDTCLHFEGNVCWQPDRAGASERTRTIALFASSSMGTLAALLGVVSLGWARARRRMRDTRALILKTLTHELRTPATGLTLSLEAVRADFDRLGGTGQDAVLRMCDDVNRIRRVLEASTRYLGAEGGVGVQRGEIPSVRELLEDVLRPYDGCELVVEKDGAFVTDAYWLGICVTNLVENARVHGRPPVQVRLRAAETLDIAVVDAGAGPAMPLRALRKAFVKGKHSGGLGLGLHLVDTMVHALGGSLAMRCNPTAFAISLRRQP